MKATDFAAIFRQSNSQGTYLHGDCGRAGFDHAAVDQEISRAFGKRCADPQTGAMELRFINGVDGGLHPLCWCSRNQRPRFLVLSSQPALMRDQGNHEKR
jgi:hypothetical protein